ncbi:PIN domain-containing protein [Novosphingobium sp.]|uniref:PIN domain-containing protein n=1 Tax=Novosphingobium sp. TaxID=1874826 RepID=UPI0031DDC739
MHLLDTPIVLALREARGGTADPGLTAWATGVSRQSLFISALILHELESEAVHVARQDKAAGAVWRAWIDDQVMQAFNGRVLSIDAPVVRRAAQLGYEDQRDGLLAATALEHGFTLVTLRPRAFRQGRVRLFNPLGYVPATGVDDWRQAARAGPAWIKNLFVRS